MSNPDPTSPPDARPALDPIDDPEHIRALAKHWEAEVAPGLRGATHYGGCERDHRNCALWILARAINLGVTDEHP